MKPAENSTMQKLLEQPFCPPSMFYEKKPVKQILVKKPGTKVTKKQAFDYEK